MEAFGRRGRFMARALEALGPKELRSLFRKLGVGTEARPDSCVFPRTGGSAGVLRALIDRLDPGRCEVLTSIKADGLLIEGGRVRGVRAGEKTFRAERVILACGGQSYPGLGGAGGGYALAAAAGHSIVPTFPALVPLVTLEEWPGGLAGVGLTEVEIRVRRKSSRALPVRGALLFTHEGLSGPAALDISGSVAALLQKESAVEIVLNLFPGQDAGDWRERLELWRRESGRTKVVSLLGNRMPRDLAERVCRLAGFDPAELYANQLRREQLDSLPRILTGLSLTVTGTAGFARAMVTRGGASLREVDPETLESRLVKGLYLCGELLDLDGPCGGYNLQWAFSSGNLAGLGGG